MRDAGRLTFKRACVMALVATLALAVSACSAASGGGAGSLPLSALGIGASTEEGMPAVLGNDPGGEYAFVFGNQIWIKSAKDSAPRQFTHLALPANGQFAWGPLMWSPDDTSIAFVLVQDASGALPRSDGPLYVANVATGDVQATSGTASVLGHSYAWYGSHALFYANGLGITFYDLSDPSDPRPYQPVQVGNGPSYASGDPHFTTYTDIQVSGQSLYATRIDVASFGALGQVGRAVVVQYSASASPDGYSGGNMSLGGGGQVANLGLAYADSHGHVTAGAWQIAPDGGSMVYQQVNAVDVKAATTTSKICYRYQILYGCDQVLFQSLSTQPVDAAPQFGLSGDGSLVAMSGSALGIVRNDGTQSAKSALVGWGAPPQWSSDGKLAVATQLVSATPDVAGVIHYATNVVRYPVGGTPSTLIAHAQDFSWAP